MSATASRPPRRSRSASEHYFKRDRTYPDDKPSVSVSAEQHVRLNIAVDQQGPVSFHWSLRSHAGDWKAGGADRFGRSVQQPLLAWRADGKNAGTLPASGSFMSVDAPNVTCSVIKPAEANGRGFIIRLNETTGKETTATVSLPMLPAIESANATSLVENDRPEQYPVTGNTFKITLPKFGVKTIRVTCAGKSHRRSPTSTRKAVADMQVDLSWKTKAERSAISTSTATRNRTARPTLELHRPIRHRQLHRPAAREPRRLAAQLPRARRRPTTTGSSRWTAPTIPARPAPSPTVTTPASEQANLPPVAVEGLRAILVSPICKDNFVNLLFRTACEPDVTQYEIHRGTQPGFAAGPDTLVGVVKSDDIPPRSGGYGEPQITVQGQGLRPRDVRRQDRRTRHDLLLQSPRRGRRRPERRVLGRSYPSAPKKLLSERTAQSIYAPEFDADNALDGDPDPFARGFPSNTAAARKTSRLMSGGRSSFSRSRSRSRA